MAVVPNPVGWPVSWEPAVALARAEGRDPDTVLDDPRLAAHRVLDRLAAVAAEVRDDLPGARQSLRGLLADTLRALSWLSPSKDGAGSTADDIDCASGETAIRAPRHDDAVQPAPVTLVRDDGLSALAAMARCIRDRNAATAVRRLGALARAVEKRIPGLSASRVSEPAGWSYSASPPDMHGVENRGAPTMFTDTGLDGAWWQDIVRAEDLDLISPCQSRLASVSDADLAVHAPPVGTAFVTEGIGRVDVPDPCGPAPLMTIHGQGFGPHKPPTVSVVVATWSSAPPHVVYRNAQTVSWTDDTVVVQLPSGVVSGTAAFADLDYISDYNSWADDRNRRVTSARRANGCPGNWTVEEHLSRTPEPDAAASP